MKTDIIWKWIIVSIFACSIQNTKAKPRISNGTIIEVESGQKTFIECFGNRDLNWYKLTNASQVPSLIAEEEDDVKRCYSGICLLPVDQHYQNYEDYVDWPDPFEYENETNIAVLIIGKTSKEHAGTYVCIYEKDDLNLMTNRIRLEKHKYYTTTELKILVLKPVIDNGRQVQINGGQSINMTCRGEKPVTWILLNNKTSGIQHTENTKTEFVSILHLENVNYTDVGYFVCAFTDSSKAFYEDDEHLTDPNSQSIYLFVKDVNHLLTVDGEFHHISKPISTNLVIPCKPTFKEVKVELVGADSSLLNDKYFHFTKSKEEGGQILHHEVLNETLYCFASYQDKREHVVFNFEFYNSILSGTNVDVEGAWQINPFVRDIQSYDVIESDVLFINCSAPYSELTTIKWKVPPAVKNMKTGAHVIEDLTNPDANKLLQRRMITDVSLQRDAGVYKCYVTNNHVNSSIQSFALNPFPKDSSHLELKAQLSNITLEKAMKLESVKWIIYFRSYPGMILKWRFNDDVKIHLKIEEDDIDHKKSLIFRKDHYIVKISWLQGEVALMITSPSVRDVGIYNLEAESTSDSSVKQNITLRFAMETAPENVEIHLKSNHRSIEKKEKIFQVGEEILLVCSALGYPLPNLTVYFMVCELHEGCKYNILENIENKFVNEENQITEEQNYGYNALSQRIWTANAKVQGKYICIAENSHGKANSSLNSLIITDSELEEVKPLQLELVVNQELTKVSSEIVLIQGDEVRLSCRGNTLKTSKPLSWKVHKNGMKPTLLVGDYDTLLHGQVINIAETRTNYSYISTIKTVISIEMDGLNLTCYDSSESEVHTAIKVQASSAPNWKSEPLNKKIVEKTENEKFNFSCLASGSPQPTVRWFKNGIEMDFSKNNKRIALQNGNISFAYLFSEDSGKYTCQIENRVGLLEDYLILDVRDPDADPNSILYISIGVISFLLCIVLIAYFCKVRSETKRNKKIMDHKRKIFENGIPEAISPDLDLGEQADLLPYDKKFEFPKEKIMINKLLGSGAFGNVFKATANDLKEGEAKSTVAVKMMKACNDDQQLKTFISELKIMIHIGRHINIVNLLGACSQDIAKGELLLIVEYCRHGNILDYMRRHKLEFVNQINELGKIDATRIFRQRTFSGASQTSAFKPNYVQLDLQRQSSILSAKDNIRYSAMDNVKDARNMSECEPFLERCRIQSESGADNVETFCSNMTIATTGHSTENYVSETTLEKRGSLNTKDLLHWSYQIANGMFYLSERKVIHGDLAARNILLTDRNVVKISDFGLSKNVYKKEQYKKKSKGLLPVKWSALEVLKENVFSTQSDVWSFGVVLWEIFTLGLNPYPSCEVDEYFIQKLEKGLRLNQPQFAPIDVYSLMSACWLQNPNSRPGFKFMEKHLGEMLGETEKEVYMNLNAQYEENNSVSDLLKMVRTPSYNSKVNGNFFEDNQNVIGYEVPIDPHGSTIIMEDHIIPKESIRVPLQDPPLRRKHLSLILQERRSLMLSQENRTDDNYMLMSSPTTLASEKAETKFTFDDVLPVYQNVHSLPSKDGTTSPSIEKTENSNNDLYTDEGSVESSDSVFLHSPITNEVVGFSTGNRRKRQDSGLGSSTTLQMNPLYSSDFTKPSMSTFKPVKDRKSSDTSSGFGSLGKDKTYSIEEGKLKVNNNNLHCIISAIEEVNNSGGSQV